MNDLETYAGPTRRILDMSASRLCSAPFIRHSAATISALVFFTLPSPILRVASELCNAMIVAVPDDLRDVQLIRWRRTTSYLLFSTDPFEY
jgi:hypothetical protein